MENNAIETEEWENLSISSTDLTEENTNTENSIEENATENSFEETNVVEDETNNVIENITNSTENETTSNTLVDENSVTLSNIHEDLIFIGSILIFLVIYLLIKTILKFFHHCFEYFLRHWRYWHYQSNLAYLNR